MNGPRFDSLVRSLHGSRRALLAGGIAVSASWLGAPAIDARNKNKKRKNDRPKPKPNEFGCLEVGDPCKSEDQCCSGVCDGKKGKRACRAHDTGTCKQDGQLVPCNNRTTCGCFRTTAGSDICSELFGPSACAACQRDADCEALGFPAGSACGPSPIPCDTGAMACFVPCGAQVPEA